MSLFLVLLLPTFAYLGWYIAEHKKTADTSKPNVVLPKDYLVGLNFLLEEQPDKALDIFIKLLHVDSDTVETHLALGGLFRRRGEVDRAIRIHQNLIARPNLTIEHRTQALLALGQDYFRAGMLDRAEKVFLDLIENIEVNIQSLKFLKEIYQQEKSWEKAIHITQKLESLGFENLKIHIAHYYCELAALLVLDESNSVALNYLTKALQIDKTNVRASLMLGDFYMKHANYKQAIKYFEQVKHQDPDFLSEALSPLAQCYEEMGKIKNFVSYLKQCLQEYARISVVLILSDYVVKEYGITAAQELITQYLKIHPSIRGLNRLIELQKVEANLIHIDSLCILNDIIHKILEKKPIYRCTQCGFSAKTLHWLCPGCRNWSSIKPIHGLEGD